MTVKISIPATLVLSGSVGRQTIGSLGSSEDSTNGSLKKPTFSERHPKVVRSLTVVAYIFCVSLAAIVLSAYYVVLWTPSSGIDSSKAGNMNTTSWPCPVNLGNDSALTSYAKSYHRTHRRHPSSYSYYSFLKKQIMSVHLPEAEAMKQERLEVNETESHEVSIVSPDAALTHATTTEEASAPQTTGTTPMSTTKSPKASPKSIILGILSSPSNLEGMVKKETRENWDINRTTPLPSIKAGHERDT